MRLDGTSHLTYTSREGTYRFEVPPGNYSLRGSFTGLDEQTFPIAVQAGGTVVQNIPLTSGIYKLDKFVVSSEREGNAQAITLRPQ